MDHKELELIANNLWTQMDKEITDWRNTHNFREMTDEQRDVVVAELNGRRESAIRAFEFLIDEVAKIRCANVLSKLNLDNKIEPIKLLSQ